MEGSGEAAPRPGMRQGTSGLPLAADQAAEAMRQAPTTPRLRQEAILYTTR